MASVLAGTAEFAGAAALALASAAGFVFAGAVFELVSVGASGFAERIETLPVRAGIEISSADRKNAVAAPIVNFDKTVAVPRGPNAELEILLVNNAPASVLPGCSKTDATSRTHEAKKIVYKI